MCKSDGTVFLCWAWENSEAFANGRLLSKPEWMGEEGQASISWFKGAGERVGRQHVCFVSDWLGVYLRRPMEYLDLLLEVMPKHKARSGVSPEHPQV